MKRNYHHRARFIKYLRTSIELGHFSRLHFPQSERGERSNRERPRFGQ